MTTTLNANPSHAPLELLGRMMDGYPCYAFISNEDATAAKALFRGRWSWDTVAAYLNAQPTTVTVTDERASGFMRFRLYATQNALPVCLAEIEVYLARGRQEKQFWCKTAQRAGHLGLAA